MKKVLTGAIFGNFSMLSIVIPARDAETTLQTTLETCVQAPAPRDIIVVDGQSTDATRHIALSYGARVVSSPPGRGTQLSVGGDAATGDWLLFLHADTQLGEGWQDAVLNFTNGSTNSRKAAVFHLDFNDPTPAARRVARMANWRSRVLGLPYGDQGLLISRTYYDDLNGYQCLPIMEDVNFARRVGKSNFVMLDAVAVTSSARYQRDGYWMRPIRNLFLLGLYFLGVSPNLLAKAYN